VIRPRKLSRRRFVLAGAAAALGACGRGGGTAARGADGTSGSGPTDDNPSDNTNDHDTSAASGGTRPVAVPPAGSVNEPGTLPPTSRDPTASGLQAPARYVAHGPRSNPRVALTFHASGDPVLAQRLLDVLAAHQTSVTVFGVGQWLAAHPDLVARIQRDGHELANHTLSHEPMGQMSATSIAREITGCADVLRRLTGSISAWFRPSGIDVPTGTILVEAGRAGYPVSVGYDVDSLDFRDPGAAAIETTVRDGMQAGSIVSLHFGHRGTIDAIGSIIDHARASGWVPVTVSRLLS